MDETPITERSSQITKSIDTAKPQDIVRMLHESDKQIFDGYEQYDNVLSICEDLEKVKHEIIQIFKSGDDSCIILSGCGTSGRLGFLTAQSFNRILAKTNNKESKIKYLLAGGDEGLFKSKELCEDDPEAGVRDLVAATKDKSRVLYIGITCGLSAPYVAGQLEYAYNHADKFNSVLMGFNPITLSRNLPVEKWNKTFRQVMEEFQRTDCGVILTPVYGPEPITGSSRMKGGTTTKILLDTLFSCAFVEAFENAPVTGIREILTTYKQIQDTVFSEHELITPGIERAGHSLLKNGHVYYVSDDSIGALGLIDASECPPTYGSAVDDVRGFIEGGYCSLSTNDGDRSDIIEISNDYFKATILPQLTEDDTVFILQSCDDLEECLLKSKATVIPIAITFDDTNGRFRFAKSIRINLPKAPIVAALGPAYQAMMEQFHIEIAMKWVCNCITTGAHILKGKVFENYMIDVKVRNDKLYRRAISIIQKFTDVSNNIAEESLLKVIHATDTLTQEHMVAAISDHVIKATNMDRAVPLALVIAKRRCTLDEAKRIVDQNPAIRKVMSSTM